MGNLRILILTKVCSTFINKALKKNTATHNFELFSLFFFYLTGFILEKSIAVNSPKRIENARIMIANTSMDTDKIKIFGARVKVDGTGKLAELERAEKVRSLFLSSPFIIRLTIFLIYTKKKNHRKR